jgi:hypothetical protein
VTYADMTCITQQLGSTEVFLKTWQNKQATAFAEICRFITEMLHK